MSRFEYFDSAPWTPDGQELNNTYEDHYQAIYPYIAQTTRWREGMRYRFCPEMWQVTTSELDSYGDIGIAVGDYLLRTGNNPTGFRLDFVQDMDGNPWITEVQTDDRGMPEMAILRNAYGAHKFLPGVVPGFIEAVRTKFGDVEDILVAYPKEDTFYYQPYLDFANIIRVEAALNDKPMNVFVRSNSCILDTSGTFKTLGFTDYTPDVVYDFTGNIDPEMCCTLPVDKSILLDMLSASADGKCKTNFACVIPQTYSYEMPDTVIADKDNWIVKPTRGRWSQGVVFGENVSVSNWQLALSEVQNGSAVVQRLIRSNRFGYPTRRSSKSKSKVSYPEHEYFLRVEGYYYLSNSGYKLADMMITGTQNQPVHGKRDCIMVPAVTI